MSQLTSEQLLWEIENLLRTMPERKTIRHELPENFSWFGRASTLIAAWNPSKSIELDGFVRQLYSYAVMDTSQPISGILTLLHTARHDLRLKTVGPLTVPIDKGSVFDYFDEVRKLIEEAQFDLLFVDPYLDADFVSRYLPHVRSGVTVRLMGKEKMTKLVPAVQTFIQQHSLDIKVRSAKELHDRFVFIDKKSCYQSGASFKDGAKTAPTTLAQVNDAFKAIQEIYEKSWNSAHTHI